MPKPRGTVFWVAARLPSGHAVVGMLAVVDPPAEAGEGERHRPMLPPPVRTAPVLVGSVRAPNPQLETARAVAERRRVERSELETVQPERAA